MHSFRARGYKRARIEDLARDADVAVGTVYNYYGTKGDILIAAVALEVEEVLAEGQVLVDAPPDDPAEALVALANAYFDHSLNYLTKEMWRQAMALAIEASDTPQGRRYAELDALLAVQVGDLVRRFQERGRIAPMLDAAAIGRVLFHTINQLFVAFVSDEAMSLETLRAQAAAHIIPIAQLLPRNDPT